MKIDSGITRNFEGIEQRVFVEFYQAYYPYRYLVKKVLALPTEEGLKSPQYRSIKRELGDDWYSDLSATWDDSTFTVEEMERIQNILTISTNGG